MERRRHAALCPDAKLVTVDAPQLRLPDQPGLRRLLQSIIGDETSIDGMERFQKPVHYQYAERIRFGIEIFSVSLP